MYILEEDPKENKENKTEKQNKNRKNLRYSKKTRTKRFDYKWTGTVFIASFFITMLLSFLSNGLMRGINIVVAVLILIFFIFVGMLFDVIGLAIATAEEKQFHSMAARRIKSAKYAIKLIRNAEKVSSICNDVIGDIAGIMSGATGTAIVAFLFVSDVSNISNISGESDLIGTLLITAAIAAVTVGSKALGKSVALNHSGEIVNIVSKVIYFFARLKKNKKNKKG